MTFITRLIKTYGNYKEPPIVQEEPLSARSVGSNAMSEIGSQLEAVQTEQVTYHNFYKTDVV
jgi:hypothetical protein